MSVGFVCHVGTPTPSPVKKVSVFCMFLSFECFVNSWSWALSKHGQIVCFCSEWFCFSPFVLAVGPYCNQ